MAAHWPTSAEPEGVVGRGRLGNAKVGFRFGGVDQRSAPPRRPRPVTPLAYGSRRADELGTALRLAEAWGYIDAAALTDARALLDRVQAMLWKLTL